MDASLRFCSCCLRKLCPDLTHYSADSVRFFVPAIDSMFRNHFAYIAIKKDVLKSICDSEDIISINLKEIAEILHLEQGDFPTEEQRQEIEAFYTPISDYQYLYKMAS